MLYPLFGATQPLFTQGWWVLVPMVVAALLLMYGPVKKLSRVNANLQQATAASERIFELLDKHTEVVELPGAVALPAFRDTIEFRDVTS